MTDLIAFTTVYAGSSLDITVITICFINFDNRLFFYGQNTIKTFEFFIVINTYIITYRLMYIFRNQWSIIFQKYYWFFFFLWHGYVFWLRCHKENYNCWISQLDLYCLKTTCYYGNVYLTSLETKIDDSRQRV